MLWGLESKVEGFSLGLRLRVWGLEITLRHMSLVWGLEYTRRRIEPPIMGSRTLASKAQTFPQKAQASPESLKLGPGLSGLI